MMVRRVHVLAWLLLAGICCRGDAGAGGELSAGEYRAELEQLLAATQQLETAGSALPSVLLEVPPQWRVRVGEQVFAIPTAGLRREFRRFEKDKSAAHASTIRSQLENLRSDIDAYEVAPNDVANSREKLNAILAAREFRDVSGPTLFDRFKEWLLGLLVSLLEHLFRSSAIPVVSTFFVYGLIVLAVLTLGFIAYRQVKGASQRASIVPAEVTVSARSWQMRMAEARAAAARDDWREAVHLAYWAGISFLEHNGTWKPDRARTPREYLRLVAGTGEPQENLAALTRVFELTWYARREADAATFSQTLQALEKLGCHSI